MALQSICIKIDELLEEHFAFQDLINRFTGEQMNFFGHEQPQGTMFTAYEEKDQLAQQRYKHNAPYFKLKMVMDYWCSLWFWDMREAAQLPSRTQWYADIRNILELDLEALIEDEQPQTAEVEIFAPVAEQQKIFEEPKQARLKAYRSGAEKQISIDTIKTYNNRKDLFGNTRLDIVKQLADKYRFFHNHLEFVEVFKVRGGFDVIVGNPPWIKIEFDDRSMLSELRPELAIRKVSSPTARGYIDDCMWRVFPKNINIQAGYPIALK